MAERIRPPRKIIEEAKNKPGGPEYSHLSEISDNDLFQLILYDPLLKQLNLRSLAVESEYIKETNRDTEAEEYIRNGSIADNKGSFYHIVFNLDLDNRGIRLERMGHPYNPVIVKINFRDRRFDGTIQASSPKFLRDIRQIPREEIPERCWHLGGTYWDYSGPADKQIPGRNSVELSLMASDPTRIFLDFLKDKGGEGGRLWVNAESLFKFISDPYDQIHKLSSLERWYKLWFQVVNRALRRKTVPVPGQVSDRGFGLLQHLITEAPKLLRPCGFTDMSVVPTWWHTWELFLEQGFLPDNQLVYEQAEYFFEELKKIKLPKFSTDILNKQRLDLARRSYLLGEIRDIDRRMFDALMSWYMLLAYTLVEDRGTKHILGIPDKYQHNFNETLQLAKDVLCKSGGVLTFPLRPTMNVWLSIPI